LPVLDPANVILLIASPYPCRRGEPPQSADQPPQDTDCQVGSVCALKDDQAKKMGWKIPPTQLYPEKAGL
jgi:hypothetical protein